MTARQILAAAAALVVAGAGAVVLRDAVRDVGQSNNVRCKEWQEKMGRWQDRQQWNTFFALVPTGVTPPQAIADRALGDYQTDGTVLVRRSGCPEADLTYQWTRSSAAGGYRVYRVRMPQYFARAWRTWAETGAAKWLGSYKTALPRCKQTLTNAQCKATLGEVLPSWRQPNGDVCLGGRLYGPGKGGTSTCTVDDNAVPQPEVVDRGAGSELTDSNSDNDGEDADVGT